MKRWLGFGFVGLLFLIVIGAYSIHSKTAPANIFKPGSGVQSASTQSTLPTNLAPSDTSSSVDTSNIDSSYNDTTSTDTSSTDTTSVNDTNLSNNNSYTNSDGNTVQSPAYSTDGSVPAGATAQCNDGTYSFSQHHQGTCSYHGGVAQWL